MLVEVRPLLVFKIKNPSNNPTTNAMFTLKEVYRDYPAPAYHSLRAVYQHDPPEERFTLIRAQLCDHAFQAAVLQPTNYMTLIQIRLSTYTATIFN